MRDSLSAAERLTLIIRFLHLGIHKYPPSYAFRIVKSTVSTVLTEASDQIWLALKGTTKLYFPHYLYAVIFCSIWVYSILHFPLILSENQCFVFLNIMCFLPVLCRIRCNINKLYNICLIIVYILGVRYSVLLFSLIRNNL